MAFTTTDRRMLRAIAEKLDVVLAFEVANLEMEEEQMANIDALRQEVEEAGTVVEGAVAAFDGLKQQMAEILAGAGVDQAVIDQLTAQIDTQTKKLAAAIAANTEAGGEVHAASM